jgi:hypothetical protein
MTSQSIAVLDRANFVKKSPESLSPEAQRLPILAVLTKAAKPFPFAKFLTEAFIVGCFDHLVLAQLCYPTEHASTVTRALEEAQIKTVSYAILGPVPHGTETDELQPVLESVAPSVKVLAIKGQSARVIATPEDLLNLQSLRNLMPNTSLQVRVPDISGNWQSLKPKPPPNPPKEPDQLTTSPAATTSTPVCEVKKSTTQTAPVKPEPDKPPSKPETVTQTLSLSTPAPFTPPDHILNSTRIKTDG